MQVESEYRPRPIDLFHPQFLAQDIMRGERVFAERQIGELRQGSSSIWARVEGEHGRHYEVFLYPNQGALECTCPRFDSHRSCKHAWAFLLHCEMLLDKQQGPSWEVALDEIERNEEEQTSERPVQISYGLDPDLSTATSLALTVYVQKLRKDGTWGRRGYLRPEQGHRLSREDQEIVSLLSGARRIASATPSWGYHYSHPEGQAMRLALPPATLSAIIEKLVATGRFLEFEGDEPVGEEPYVIAEARDWRPRMRLGSGEPRPLVGEFRSGDETLAFGDVELVLLPDWLLVGNCFHRLAADVDRRWLETFELAAVRVPADEVDQFYSRALSTSLGPALELDEGWERIPANEEAIQPVVQVIQNPDSSCEVFLQFDYDGLRCTRRTGRVVCKAETREVIERLPEFESRHLDRVAEALGCTRSDLGRKPFKLTELFEPLDLLAGEGFAVEFEGKPLKQATAVHSKVRSGTDWFDLEGGIDFGDEVASYPEILAGLKKGSSIITLSDGSRGILPADWARRLALMEAATPEGDALRFRRNQGLLLDMLLEATPKPSLDASFRKLSRGLRNFDGIKEATEPRAFRGELRPYQRKGLGWLDFLRKIGLGGCLADDMGLGKTVQVLAHLQKLKSKKGAGRPFLVVAPKSVTSNWLAEAERFAPRIPRVDYSGPGRKSLLAELPASALVVTTYGLMRRDIEQLREVGFDTVILDEAQAIKNASSQTAKAARLLDAEQRLALSGTPIENHIDELFSLFEFLNPGMFPSMRVVQDLGGGDSNDRRRLGQLIAPLLLRRRKEQVALDLPARIEQTIVCELPAPQRKIYDDVLRFQRLSVMSQVQKEGLESSKLHVLEALLRLRQIACHPALVNDDHARTKSSKIDALLAQLEEVVAEGHKALVFSQFTGLLAIVREALDKQGIVHEYLDGKTRNRPERIERFQTDPACPVFLISLKAGGTGLNLTAADYVFILDPWWNPAVEAQAIDRTHRIGQTNQVVAYRLIAKDTVEEKILALQERKKALADDILEGNTKTLRDLSREDIEALLS